MVNASSPASTPASGGGLALATPEGGWRTRDIIVTAVIGVAFGVVFWAWGLAWPAFEPLNGIFPVARDLLYAVWLVPAVLAPLIVRKPGAALFAEMVAAGVSALIGSQWGVDTLLSGFVQGAAAELVFAFAFYRSYGFPVLALAAVASAAAAWIHDCGQASWKGSRPDDGAGATGDHPGQRARLPVRVAVDPGPA